MLEGDGMEEIKQLFFEESAEGLDTMEDGLLNLDAEAADLEVINDIFRAAHSLKGGAATFGFNSIAEFTHSMETLLDEMRDETRKPTPDAVDLLLRSVDCVRTMMDFAQNGEDRTTDEIAAVLKEIEAMLGVASTDDSGGEGLEAYVGEVLQDASVQAQAKEEAGGAEHIWRIKFSPHHDFLKTGSRPHLIFRELEELGEMSVKACFSELPSLSHLDPHGCYVSWNIELKTAAKRSQIETVFEWIDDCCDLTFESDTAPCVVAPAELVAESPTVNEEAATCPEPDEKQAETTAEAALAENAPAEKAKPAKAAAASKTKSAGSIRVGIDKIDALLNLVGELVITQSMLKKVGGELGDTTHERLESGLNQLESNARELQEVAMKMRMLPINNNFSRFPRMVHDLCKQLGKKVDLQISGEHTELDKTVLEKVNDPLVHLVRNALDHGVEMPEDRAAAGKPETGVMQLSAKHEAGNIVISISDDGAGINPEKVLGKARERGLVGPDEELTIEEINQLIFRPGFSTAEVVSDVSGRGVGMDVVRRNIQDLGGRVEVESEFGKGSTIKIRLPLTMAILEGQLVRVGSETYVVPLLNIVESVVVEQNRINFLNQRDSVYQLRKQNIPMIYLDEAFGVNGSLENTGEENQEKILVIVELGNEQVGLLVDELLDQQQVVIKSLETNYKQLDGLSGATILGDGAVALILDLDGVAKLSRSQRAAASRSKAEQQVSVA